ncbi:cyclin-D1-binding protein 1 homolog [Octopus sinensis]|uniref:Cyclin-D1-binding protein 1 homolog n=1 Tax=Octopus sinensis TaxID=2607531 RepID=A0A6P7T8M8_9MOLL|nr:cyclin-D1-binding protein 1 homolog [Octopus sinensis]
MAYCRHSENVFNDVIDHLGLAVSQLRDGESDHAENTYYTKDEYWNQIRNISLSLSHDVTLISMAFSKTPYPTPEAVTKMLSKLEMTALTLVSSFYMLPKTQGLLLRDSFKKSTIELIEKVNTFIKSIQTGSASSPEMLYKTGIVWEHSDFFSSQPKDNKQAIVDLMRVSMGLIADALQELEQGVTENGQFDDIDDIMVGDHCNEDEWSEEDKTLLGPSQGLIKVANHVLKEALKTTMKNGKCDTAKQISQYDDLADHVKKLSPAVDQLGIALYPPMGHRFVRAYSEHLAEILRNFLNCLRSSHVTDEDDEQWLEFLLKAVEHNTEKIHGLTD